MGAVLKYWNGSAWVAKPLKYWTGSAWVTKQIKYWNGSAWIGGAAVTVYQDNFDRADATLNVSPVASGGWSWTHDGLIASAASVNTNQLRCNTATGSGSAYKTPALSSANHYVQYKVANVSLSSGPFVAGRLLDNNNFIGVRNSGTVIEVYRRVSSTLTALYTSASAAVAIGDVLRLEISGSNPDIVLKKNGTIIPAASMSAAAATLTSVGTGIVARTVIGIFADDFEVGLL